MSNSQPSQVDLEPARCNNGGGRSGHRRAGAVSEGGGPPFPVANEIVQVAENINNSNKEKHERKESSKSECSVEIVDLEVAALESKLHLGKIERDCRICQLSMDVGNQDSEIPIELGCSCKDDLAAAHKQCAEAWFKETRPARYVDPLRKMWLEYSRRSRQSSGMKRAMLMLQQQLL